MNNLLHTIDVYLCAAWLWFVNLDDGPQGIVFLSLLSIGMWAAGKWDDRKPRGVSEHQERVEKARME